MEPDAVVADAAEFVEHPRTLQHQDPGCRKEDHGPPPDLLGAQPAFASHGTALFSGQHAKHAFFGGDHLCRLCRNQRVLDADRRHRKHLFPRDLCGGRGFGLYHDVAFDRTWVAVVQSADCRWRSWLSHGGGNRGSCAAVGWVLLCLADPWLERIVPGVLYHLKDIRLGLWRALRRGFLHLVGLGPCRAIVGRLLRRVRVADRRAVPVPLNQRQKTGPHPSDGAGKARGICASLRCGLSPCSGDYLSDHLGGLGPGRRLLCLAVSWCCVFDLQLRHGVVGPCDADHWRHWQSGRGDPWHAGCHGAG